MTSEEIKMSTKSILDNKENITKLDQDDMYGGVASLADQVRHAWEETQKLDASGIKDISSVVVAGMGGSGRGANIIKSLLKERLTIPLDIVHDYDLPGYVNESTLVILTSVSGSTEETLQATKEAHLKKAQIAIMTGGGELLKLAQQENYLHYRLDMKQNPSKQSRIAQGYTIMGLIGLLSLVKVIEINEDEVDEILTTLIATGSQYDQEVKTDKNPAKTLAFQIIDRRPVIIVADFLEGIAHTLTNQLHENAKIFADFRVIPEMNHHLLEGFRFPKSNTSDHIFVIVKSDQYHQRNQKRIDLTAKLIEDHDIETLSIELTSSTKLTQAFELLNLFNYASFYLSILEEIDPAPIPAVDWFKSELVRE